MSDDAAAQHGGQVKRTRRAAPDTWRVVEKDGSLVHVHETSGRPLSSYPEDEQVRILWGMGFWALIAHRLDVTTDRLLNHEMTHGPLASRKNDEVAQRNFGLLALARATRMDVRRLSDRDRQLRMDLGRAA